MEQVIFRDRVDAGQRLARLLVSYLYNDAIVYALPRGGVVLGVEVVKALDAPLDLLIPRKIGHPMNPEFALCAVSEDGSLVCNSIGQRYKDKEWLSALVEKEIAEAKRRRDKYLDGRPPLSAENKTAIIVDDGIATGLTMLAAINDVRHRNPADIVVAIPVVPSDIAQKLKEIVTLVALDIPTDYAGSVGAYYEKFPQISDDEVIQLLQHLSADD